MTTKKIVNYINNKDFYDAMVKYTTDVKNNELLGLPKPKIPEYIGECFMKIAENLSHKPNFIKYTFRSEMVSDAIESCIRYAHCFDPAISSNPFSYFTQFAFYAFLRRIELEREELYVKYKSTEQFGCLGESQSMNDYDGRTYGTPADDDHHVRQFEMYDNIAEFIEKFETKKNTKKRKRKIDD